jgi:hypothetical protein
MIAYVSAVIAASPVGRTYAKVRNGPVRRLAASPVFDWVIPSALVVTIVISMTWVIFFAK